MASQLAYGPAQPAERDALARILAESFAMPEEDEERWLAERVGTPNVRVLRDGAAVVAGLAILPGFGQYFGGRRVPCAGIAGVGTDPRVRGKGAATVLVRAAVQELHRTGVPLAALYPATQPLYRRAGFEQAGGRWTIRAAPAALDLKDRTLPLREVGPADLPALAEVHREVLRGGSGGMDRSDYLWDRVFAPGGHATRGTGVVGAGGALEGYVFARSAREGDVADLRVSDLVARTPAAATRLLTFLADHRTIIRDVVWFGAAADPLLALVREQQARVTLKTVWMLRIVDVPAALASRGYAQGLSGELHLEVFDEVIPENRGRFLLEVGGGTGRVRPGGEGRLKVHVRGLASLYSGWLAPDALALTGLLEGDAAERQRAAALFAGPQPAMTDMF